MKVHDKYDHYIDSSDEVYSVGKGSAKFDAVDRKVVAIFTEDDLPEVTEVNGSLRVAGKSGLFPDSSLFAGEPIEVWVLALLAIQHHRAERTAKRERVEREAQRLADLFSRIDPNPHGWYTADKPLIRELVSRGVIAPPEES